MSLSSDSSLLLNFQSLSELSKTSPSFRLLIADSSTGAVKLPQSEIFVTNDKQRPITLEKIDCSKDTLVLIFTAPGIASFVGELSVPEKVGGDLGETTTTILSLYKNLKRQEVVLADAGTGWFKAEIAEVSKYRRDDECNFRYSVKWVRPGGNVAEGPFIPIEQASDVATNLARHRIRRLRLDRPVARIELDIRQVGGATSKVEVQDNPPVNRVLNPNLSPGNLICGSTINDLCALAVLKRSNDPQQLKYALAYALTALLEERKMSASLLLEGDQGEGEQKITC